jgi:hypothetical protein
MNLKHVGSSPVNELERGQLERQQLKQRQRTCALAGKRKFAAADITRIQLEMRLRERDTIRVP